MNTAQKVLSNTAVQAIGRLTTAAVSIIILKIISGYLGTAGYGAYTTVYEFLAFFAIVADFGIFQIAVKEMSAAPERRTEIFGNVFALRLCLATGAMLAAIGAAFLIPKYSGTPIPAGVAIASATTFLTLIFGTLSSLLQVDLRMQWNVLGLIASKFIALGWMLATIFRYFPDDPQSGFFQLLVAGAVGGLFQVAIVFWAARRDTLRLRFDFKFWKKLMVKTLPYGGAVLLATIYVRIDVILLSLMRTQEEVGIYGVAARVMENLAVISIFFLNSALPSIARLYRTNRDRLKKLLQYAFDFLALVGLPITVGGIALAYPIIALVSSPEFLSNYAIGFYGSDLALQILLIAMLLAYIGNLFGFSLLAGNAQIKLFYVNAAAVVFNLLSNIAVIPFWGFRGAAATSVASQIFVCILGFLFLRKMLKGISFKLGTAAKALLAALTMGVSVWWLEPLFFNFFGGNKGVLFLIPAGGAVYITVLFLTQAITPEMRALLKKKV
ncbi:MAG: flippase [Candidatus Peribacteraceae bacterium]|nr:flippase [Candidatus Peribacteraceae bacterium]